MGDDRAGARRPWRDSKTAGLTSLQTGMDNIRGIIGCPATGLTRRSSSTPVPSRAKFQRIFVGNKAFTNLPRKFNVTITGCPEHCTPGETQDISMTPAITMLGGGAVVGLNVAVGGKLGSGRAGCSLRRWTPSSAPKKPPRCARASPSSTATTAPRIAQQGAPGVSHRRVGRGAVPQGARGAARPALPGAGRDARGTTTSDHIGVFRQCQPGLNYVGLKTPVGRVSGDQLPRAGTAGRALRPR